MSDYKDLTIGALRAQIAALEAENATLRADWEAEDAAASKHMGMVKRYLPSAHHAEEIFPYIDRLREREAALAAALDIARQEIEACRQDVAGTYAEARFAGVLAELADPAAILARVRREAKREMLWGLKAVEIETRDEDGICQWVAAVDYDDVLAAIDALDAEEKGEQNG